MKKIIVCYVFLMLLSFGVSFAGESWDTLTIVTYYPSPYGDYNELTTHSNTNLAITGGNVGIGTTAPGIYGTGSNQHQAKIDVNGYAAANDLYLKDKNTWVSTMNSGELKGVCFQPIAISGGSCYWLLNNLPSWFPFFSNPCGCETGYTLTAIACAQESVDGSPSNNYLITETCKRD